MKRHGKQKTLVPMPDDRRKAVYLRQTGAAGHPASTLGLTPRQRRRWVKKARAAAGRAL